MQSFGQNIWTMNGDDIRMFGMLPFTTRMTVVLLESGVMWLHSPVRPTPDRRRVVVKLGPGRASRSTQQDPQSRHRILEGVVPFSQGLGIAWVRPASP